MEGMSDVQRRRGPLSLLVGGRSVTLLSAHANLLIDALEASAATLRRDLDRLSIEQPQSLPLAEERLDAHAALIQTLSTARSRLIDPPLSLGAMDVQLLRGVFAEMVGYQRQQLTSDLEQLKLAVNRSH
jgi:hypothetical protein